LIVIDTREQLRRSAQQGRWPHGFHNGYIGQGHLNAVGNSLVAAHLIRSISLSEITYVVSDFAELNTTIQSRGDKGVADRVQMALADIPVMESVRPSSLLCRSAQLLSRIDDDQP
jgi:hypothetical protein